MSTRDRILAVLRGREARSIRFTFPASGGRLTIDHHTFLNVAKAIEDNKVHITVTNTFPPGVGAQYHPDTNTIETPAVLGRGDEGLVLHECTHASFDLASTAIVALDDEAAGYVVDALYFRLTGLPRPRWNAPLHAAAGRVADDLRHQEGVGSHVPPPVNDASWGMLRTAIGADPVYKTGPAGTGGSYLHNG